LLDEFISTRPLRQIPSGNPNAIAYYELFNISLPKQVDRIDSTLRPLLLTSYRLPPFAS
jgi:hypothetical protein